MDTQLNYTKLQRLLLAGCIILAVWVGSTPALARFNPWPVFFHGHKSKPIIDDAGMVYFSSGNSIYCISPEGNLNWSFVFGSKITGSPAIGIDGAIIGISGQTLIYLNSNGTLAWEQDMGGELVTTPIIDPKGAIYVFREKSTLLAIRPDGTPKDGNWSQVVDRFDYFSSPAMGSDGRLYLGTGEGYCQISETGVKTHLIRENGWCNEILLPPPVVGADGTVFVGTGGVHALSPNGSRKWFSPTKESGRSFTPAIGADGTVYVGAGIFNYSIFAINPDGTEKWCIPWEDGSPSGLAVGLDNTLCLWSGKKIVALDSEGSRKWSIDTWDMKTSIPVIEPGGTVYFTNRRGLHAINPDGNQKWSFIPDDVEKTIEPVAGRER